MAHPNILQRQAKVWKLLDEGDLTHSEIKNQLSVEFNCPKTWRKLERQHCADA